MNFKKILATVLTMCLITGSILFVNAESNITVSLDNAEVNSGKEFEVNLSLSNNTGIAGFSLAFEFDNTLIKPLSFENKSSFTSLTTINSGDIDLDSISQIIVNYDSTENIDTNGVVGTFRFKAVDNIDTAVASIRWLTDFPQADVFNANIESVAYSTVDAEITINGSKPISSSTTTTESTETTTTTITTTTEKQPSTVTTTEKQPSTVTTTEKQPSTVITTEKQPSTTTTEADVQDSTNSDISTETTTAAVRPSSGGGGGGGSAKKTTTATTTESTTETTTAAETATEAPYNSSNKEEAKPVITNSVMVNIGSNTIVIGDESYTMDAAAYIQAQSNSTLVPLRFVAIAILGGDVENADTGNIIAWNGETKTATITAGGNAISFTAGSDIMTINGVENIMENGVKAEIKDGRMYIPFRALGVALDVEVSWNADIKTASYKMK